MGGGGDKRCQDSFGGPDVKNDRNEVPITPPSRPHQRDTKAAKKEEAVRADDRCGGRSCVACAMTGCFSIMYVYLDFQSRIHGPSCDGAPTRSVRVSYRTNATQTRPSRLGGTPHLAAGHHQTLIT